MEFAAKVDTWFLAIFYGVGTLMLAMAVLMRSKPAAARVLLVVLGVLFVGIGVTTQDASYVITPQGQLVARGFWSRGPIAHVDQIHRIEPSSDPRASQAASLDRLRIDYEGGGVVFIAVEDKGGFLDAVVAASEGLQREGMTVSRGLRAGR